MLFVSYNSPIKCPFLHYFVLFLLEPSFKPQTVRPPTACAMLSPSSSSSSLDSVFDRTNSGASTPSSILSSLSSRKSTGANASQAFAICVFVQSTAVEPDLVTLAFSTYSQDNYLGLCVPNCASLQDMPFKKWKQTNITVKGRTVNLSVSDANQFYLKQEDVDLSTVSLF